ncbi:hypothetical protein [Embleya sp. AB8]|uniref:hypothetical protein n=1 Tax=Embleya sp. AB8 TaxID=3156304 RepID=UPI003C75483C
MRIGLTDVDIHFTASTRRPFVVQRFPADHPGTVRGGVIVGLVEEAGHQVLWDRPERSDRLMREFVRAPGLSVGTP